VTIRKSLRNHKKSISFSLTIFLLILTGSDECRLTRVVSVRPRGLEQSALPRSLHATTKGLMLYFRLSVTWLRYSVYYDYYDSDYDYNYYMTIMTMTTSMTMVT